MHTPGPWMCATGPSGIVGWPVVGLRGRMIADVSIINRQNNVTKESFDAYFGECQANARLMAAAPELLEALKVIVANHRLISDPAMQHATDTASVPLDDIETAINAIAKADGK